MRHVFRSSTNTRRSLIFLLILGDTLACYSGLSAAYWLRFETPLRGVGLEEPHANYMLYLPLLYVGTLFYVGTFATLDAYNPALLLRPQRSMSILVRSVFFWVLAYLGTSLALKFDPAISRLFVVIGAATTLLSLAGWRLSFHRWLAHSDTRDKITQPLLVVGWSRDAARLVDAIRQDRNHPYEFVGYVSSEQEKPNEGMSRAPLETVGRYSDIERLLAEGKIEILVIADLELSREELVRIATLCERYYVAFKIIPSFFQIFISNLRLQTISGVSILGVEALPLNSLPNQLIKRAVDIIGALFGLAVSAPIVAMLALVIKRESPGPVIYRQTRIGLNGEPFPIYKLRSMRLDAESASGARWAQKNDPRRLRIGAFMREWNLDEIPQFWNVLKGDMSLVGPRPERPELIKEFERTIPHYNPRHSVRPGLSGWAQVNGLRGDTSLVERVKYDLFYIENWSIWFDFQIMVLTFFRNKNAY